MVRRALQNNTYRLSRSGSNPGLELLLSGQIYGYPNPCLQKKKYFFEIRIKIYGKFEKNLSVYTKLAFFPSLLTPPSLFMCKFHTLLFSLARQCKIIVRNNNNSSNESNNSLVETRGITYHFGNMAPGTLETLLEKSVNHYL